MRLNSWSERPIRGCRPTSP